MKRIVIVEDEETVREELQLLLENEGYQAVALTEFTNLAGRILAEKPDLILLDLGLPERDGGLVCADIRKKAGVPIIFVTSRDSAGEELRALSLGGDDYITKPYNIPILLAHVKAVLRRGGRMEEPELLEAGGMRLSLTRGILWAITPAGDGGKEKSIELTRNELRILAYLMTHEGEIVSRADLIETLWDNQIYIDDNTLSVNMTRLRARLAELGLPDKIRTRRGMGYQL